MTEHHLEFISLKGGCTGSSESTLVKMPHWKSHVTAHLCNLFTISSKIFSLTLFILMDFPIHIIDTISKDLSILYFKGSHVKMYKFNIFLSQKIVKLRHLKSVGYYGIPSI